MHKIEFDVDFSEGVFTKLCQEFIKYKRGLGQKYPRANQYVLRELCLHLNNLNVKTPILTKDTIDRFSEKRAEESKSTQAKRIRFLQQFATYMLSLGFEAYVFPKQSIPRYNYDFKPYLFSSEQILTIIKTADSIVACNISPKAHLVYPAIIRTLYGCGLRSAEARTLKVCNVDLELGVLLIEKSKNNMSRIVPMSESLRNYLKKYSLAMNIFSKNEVYFFPAPDGGFYHQFSLQVRCHKLFELSGIPRLSNGRFPRVHDIRHAHIGHSLNKLIKTEGMDIYSAIPIIAAYVGHTNFKDTERYLHLPEFEFSDIVKTSQALVSNAIPEVLFDE